MHRSTTQPIWQHEDLVLKEAYRPQGAIQLGEADDFPEFDDDDGEDLTFALEPPPHDTGLQNSEDEDGVSDDERDRDQAKRTFDSFLQIYQEQQDIGNTRFVDSFIDNLRGESSFRRISGLVEDTNRIRNQRTMPMTWARHNHPSSMYYRQA